MAPELEPEGDGVHQTLSDIKDDKEITEIKNEDEIKSEPKDLDDNNFPMVIDGEDNYPTKISESFYSKMIHQICNQSCICRFGEKYYKFDYKRPSSSPTWSTKTRLPRDKTTRYLKIQRPELGRSCYRIHGSLADLPPREKTDPFAMQAKKLRPPTVF